VSEFFESEVVKQSIKEIEKLQQEIIEKTFLTPSMTKEGKKEHIELMRTFLEKQKNLFFRLSLSEDPEALEMKERIKEAAKFLGYNKDKTMIELFKDMEETLDKLEKIAEM
jgi:hypothetical protein